MSDRFVLALVIESVCLQGCAKAWKKSLETRRSYKRTQNKPYAQIHHTPHNTAIHYTLIKHHRVDSGQLWALIMMMITMGIYARLEATDL